MKICLEKYVRWKRLHNALKTLERVDFSRSFLFYTVNDVRRKPYMVEICLTVGEGAKEMPDTTVETTVLVPCPIPLVYVLANCN